MATFNIHQAKTCLSQLLARVEAGEEIVLTRGSRPVAKLIPFTPVPSKREFGALATRDSLGWARVLRSPSRYRTVGVGIAAALPRIAWRPQPPPIPRTSAIE